MVQKRLPHWLCGGDVGGFDAAVVGCCGSCCLGWGRGGDSSFGGELDWLEGGLLGVVLVEVEAQGEGHEHAGDDDVAETEDAGAFSAGVDELNRRVDLFGDRDHERTGAWVSNR